MPLLEVVVVDDEPVAIRRLVALLKGIDGVKVAGTAANADEALALIRACDPDLALVDIEMPGLNGIGLAAKLRAMSTPPAVVFVTAFSRFAVEAFDLQATDYLLKPVEAPRLAEAIERVRSQREQGLAAGRVAELEGLVRRLREMEHSPPATDMMWLSDGQGCDRLRAIDIRWIEAERDYVRIHTSRRSYFVRGRLGDFEARLSATGMVRVHRSALVRASTVARIEASGERGYRLILDDGTAVEVSRRFGTRVREIAATTP